MFEANVWSEIGQNIENDLKNNDFQFFFDKCKHCHKLWMHEFTTD